MTSSLKKYLNSKYLFMFRYLFHIFFKQRYDKYLNKDI